MKNKSFRDKTKDDVARYWNSRPCNVKHSNQVIGSIEYFNEVEARKYFVEPHIPAFANFSQWNGKHVLEIGCGIGTDTINFARAGAFVTAVDLSEKSIEIARQRANVFGVQEKIEFYCADAEHLSDVVPSKVFDLIYSFGVVHHTPNPQNVIAQIKQYYSDEHSTLKLMVYHRNSFKVFRIVWLSGKGFFNNVDSLIANHSEAQSGCPVTYSYSRKSINSLVKDFQILDMNVDHIFPFRIKKYIQYKYQRKLIFRILPHKVFQWLESKFGWHLMITCVKKPS